RAARVLVGAHQPPLYGLGSPREGPPSVPDGLLGDAFCGNRAIEELLARHADRIEAVFCGHTHRARDLPPPPGTSRVRGHNVGGDYHFKRLLLLTLPEAICEAHVFGTP